MVPDTHRVRSLPAKWYFAACIAIFLAIRETNANYVPPTPKIEPLYPKGLRMSIADEDGINLVAYHVKFNEDFEGLEAGTIARDIVKVRNGRWVYEDRTTKLKRGDIIYYWIHVVYERLGYNLIDQQYRVSEFYNYDGTPVNTSEITTRPPPVDRVCGYSETKVIDKYRQRQSPCSGQLIFEDNFDVLNETKWTVVERFSGPPDYEFVAYMNSNENVDVDNSNLHIKLSFMDDKYGEDFTKRGSLVLAKCTGQIDTQECKRNARGTYILPPIISGRLNTEKTFNFLYGRVQIRAKLPHGDWIYPLITLETADRNSENPTMYREIRVASSTGNSVLRVSEDMDYSGHILWAGGLTVNVRPSELQQTNRRSLSTRTSSKLWSEDYHLYELEWKPDRILVKVDGVLYGDQEVSTLFDTPLHLNLGLAVGGYGEFPDGSQSDNYRKPWHNIQSKALYKFFCARDKWNQTWTGSDTNLHVDYVKVWAL